MRKLLQKLASLTIVILLSSTMTISVANALSKNANTSNPLRQLQTRAKQAIAKGKTTLPLIIGHDNLPDTTPNRPCILMPPEYFDPNRPNDVGGPNHPGGREEIPVVWYQNVVNTFSNYILKARDLDGDGNFNSVADYATGSTPPLPVNSFNNFCFNSGQAWNWFVDEDGDGQYNEDRPGNGDEDGNNGADEDGWPMDDIDGDGIGDYESENTLDLFQGNENDDVAMDDLDRYLHVVDERKFLVAAKCNDTNATTPGVNEAYNSNEVTCSGQFGSLRDYYALTDEQDIKPGDVVRLGVYVHNNALYPDNPNAIANDVILQFDTKTNPNNPRAAISAANNIYHQDPYDVNSPTLRDVDDLDNDGDVNEILRMATDTTKLNSTVPIELQPIPGATWLYNSPVALSPPNANNSYHSPSRVTTGSTTTIEDYTIPAMAPFTEILNPSITDEDFKLSIDQIPGCFDFAGWYFFDYLVTEAEVPACDEIDVQWMQQWPSYESLPVIRDEFIPAADGNPPVPINFSDSSDEGLYIVGETASPLIIQVNRNGYEGDLTWELLITDAAGNLVPYQPNIEHFCSNAAVGIQQNNCNSGTILSDNNAGIAFNRFITNTNSILGSTYQQNTYKVYNLNRNVVLHIYAPPGVGEKTSACKEAVLFPACQDMILVSPSTVDEMTLDPATGMEIEVQTVPDYYNGPIVFGTDNSCGVFDLDDLGSNFNDDPNPVFNPATNQYEVQVEFGINDTKTVWYNINTNEPGCANNTGQGDTISMLALGTKREVCSNNFTVTETEPQFCTDIDVSVTPDVYLDDGSDTMNATIEINASTGWDGKLIMLVCALPTNPLLCMLSLDPTAEITAVNIPAGSVFDTPITTTEAAANITPVANGDQVEIQIKNIGNEFSQLYTYTIPDNTICSDTIPFEWCGDGIVNDGEECDSNDPTTPDCSDTCELPEEIPMCTDVTVVIEPDIYINDSTDVTHSVTTINAGVGWSGNLWAVVCGDTTNPNTCTISRDATATINETAIPATSTANQIPNGGLRIGPVVNGDTIELDISNIDDPNNSLYIYAMPEGFPQCTFESDFEYCGDGIVNGGEECDSNDPTTPDCSDTCELPEVIDECTDSKLTTVPTPIYLEDSSTAFDVNIDITAGASWAGSTATMICPASAANNFALCFISRDFTAQITNIVLNPTGPTTSLTLGLLNIGPITDGQNISFRATNISDPADVIATFTFPDNGACNDNAPFEYCGDGIVNGGEECDSANPLTPECTDTCTLPETPIACDDVSLTLAPNYLEDGTIVDGTVTVSADTGWIGNMTIYVCSNPTSSTSCLATLDTTAEINGTPNTPTGFAAGSVQDGDIVTFQVENISDPNMSVAAFATGLETTCNDDANFSYCGDGTEDSGETCDDGNNTDGDGCDSTCDEEIVIPPLCGDGILDTDGIDNIPNNADDEKCDDGVNNGTGPSECRADCTLPYCGDGIQDLTEDCDDGALNGTEDSTCSISCNIPSTPPGGGDSATCESLTILGDSQINSMPAFIHIQTNPSYWGETNSATFIYSSTNPNGIFGANPPGPLTTNDKTVSYRGNIGDIITVSDSVQAFGACRDLITLTQEPNPPVNPNEPEGPDSPGDDNGEGPGGDNGSEGGGCDRIDITYPTPKILTKDADFINIVSPGLIEYSTGLPANLGPFLYTSNDNNILFVDTGTPEGSAAVDNFINDGITPDQITGPGSLPESILSNELTTSSREVYYYNANIASQDTTIIVTDTNYPDDSSCGDLIQNFESELPPGPRIEKFGWVHPTGGNTTTQPNYDVNYQITYFNNGADITSVKIQDTIGENNVRKIYGNNSNFPNDYVYWSPTNDAPARGLVNLNSNPAPEVGIDTWYYGIGMHWIQRGNAYNTWGGHDLQVPKCSDPTGEVSTEVDENGNEIEIVSSETNLDAGKLCYEGRIDQSDGLDLHNMQPNTIVKFEYEGKFHAYDFFNACTDSEFIGTESFYNQAIATPEDGTPLDYIVQDNENLYATCNYMLTRNAGDVLFYTEADPGANLGALTADETRNSDGLVFIQKSLSSLINTISGAGVNGGATASQCDNPEPNNLIPHIFSSFICQVYYDPLNTNTQWKPSQVNQKVDFGFLDGTGISTDNTTLNNLSSSALIPYQQNYNNGSALDVDGSRGKIYKFNGNVTIGNTTPITLEGGAKTIIVDGNLTINSDIFYPNDTSKKDHEISSIAFIVTGNIRINSNVQNLAGVYVSRGGSYMNYGSNYSDKQLVFHGSVFGNLQPLITNRTFLGAPTLDGGNIVIRYDNRALRNTPPGLKDAIDLKWLRVAR